MEFTPLARLARSRQVPVPFTCILLGKTMRKHINAQQNVELIGNWKAQFNNSKSALPIIDIIAHVSCWLLVPHFRNNSCHSIARLKHTA